MKKYLLPETGNFYKSNLHCHSTFSDGKLTPETLKGAYMAQGYSIIAYTDHDVLIPHQELTDSRFLALNAMEIQINESADTTEVAEGRRVRKTCHICFIALDPDNVTQPCYHREKHMSKHQNELGLREKIVFDDSKPDWERIYTPEEVSKVMQEARDCGFFVTYNHPAWSCENYEQYAHYKGMHAMEICNYGCVAEGYDEYCPMIYDDILRLDNRIFCTATDDNHNGHPFGSPLCDSFGGFTVIKADKLEYKTITDALVAGNFYASQGPVINELWYEDGKIHITCEGAKKISFMTAMRRAGNFGANDGELIYEARFELRPSDRYVRVTVEDENGKHANTNAYFIDDLMKE